MGFIKVLLHKDHVGSRHAQFVKRTVYEDYELVCILI